MNTSGVCGGTASGKTTLANRIIEDLDVKWVCLLSMDSFYKVGSLLRLDSFLLRLASLLACTRWSFVERASLFKFA